MKLGPLNNYVWILDPSEKLHIPRDTAYFLFIWFLKWSSFVTRLGSGNHINFGFMSPLSCTSDMIDALETRNLWKIYWNILWQLKITLLDMFDWSNRYAPFWMNVGWLCWGLTSQSTIFQSCRDGATASWVINQYSRGVKCLAQGHNTAAVGLEPRTSRSGVRHSTTEPPRSPWMNVGAMCHCKWHKTVREIPKEIPETAPTSSWQDPKLSYISPSGNIAHWNGYPQEYVESLLEVAHKWGNWAWNISAPAGHEITSRELLV